jgi:hypothetical protein
MRGLDPRIHQNAIIFNMMDCRVKPGKDDLRVSKYYFYSLIDSPPASRNQ